MSFFLGFKMKEISYQLLKKYQISQYLDIQSETYQQFNDFIKKTTYLIFTTDDIIFSIFIK